MNKNLIIIFTRNPELGKVKTRLAKTIGDESALRIYSYLLDHTERVIRTINADKAVYYSEKINNHDIWNPSIYKKFLQNGEDLGKRMENAFENAFNKTYDKVVIVGSDLIDLDTKHIKKAFEILDNSEAVIGPASDGGYYLLGLKTLNTQVFKNKSWGTSTVLKDTLKDLQNIDVCLLEELNDIDTFEDMKNNIILKNLIKI